MVTAGVSSKVPLAKFRSLLVFRAPGVIMHDPTQVFYILNFDILPIKKFQRAFVFQTAAMAFDYWFSWASQLQAGTWPWDLGRLNLAVQPVLANGLNDSYFFNLI